MIKVPNLVCMLTNVQQTDLDIGASENFAPGNICSHSNMAAWSIYFLCNYFGFTMVHPILNKLSLVTWQLMSVLLSKSLADPAGFVQVRTNPPFLLVFAGTGDRSLEIPPTNARTGS